MDYGEFLLLALASIFWPLLIAIVIVALRTPRPVPLLGAFLTGALLTTVSVGTLVVLALDGSTATLRGERTSDATVDVVAGGVALLVAVALRRREPRARVARPHAPSRAERAVRSRRVAFTAGIVLNVIPGIFPFVALRDIAAASYPATAAILLVIVFYVIMFASVELPLLGSVVAPQWTSASVGRANDWLGRNGARLGTACLAAAGAYLLVRGLVLLDP